MAAFNQFLSRKATLGMIFKETHKQRDEDMFTPWLKINCRLIQFELAFVLVDNCACLGRYSWTGRNKFGLRVWVRIKAGVTLHNCVTFVSVFELPLIIPYFHYYDFDGGYR